MHLSRSYTSFIALKRRNRLISGYASNKGMRENLRSMEAGFRAGSHAAAARRTTSRPTRRSPRDGVRSAPCSAPHADDGPRCTEAGPSSFPLWENGKRPDRAAREVGLPLGALGLHQLQLDGVAEVLLGSAPDNGVAPMTNIGVPCTPMLCYERWPPGQASPVPSSSCFLNRSASSAGGACDLHELVDRGRGDRCPWPAASAASWNSRTCPGPRQRDRPARPAPPPGCRRSFHSMRSRRNRRSPR